MSQGDISHYRIIGALGQGAMGEVYRAVDQRLGREVALKMLPPDAEGDPDWQTRMLREAQAASALNHPGIVTLYDIATDGGRSFLVMELVNGDRLSDLARRGSGLRWRRAVELCAGVAEALAAAHALGILHRDVKSDNVMVTAAGQVKVLDFGLAKLHDDGVDLPQVAQVVALPPVRAGESPSSRSGSGSGSKLGIDLTHHGQLVGTPAYLAPECYEGPAEPRSEVFSLGVVLHELLTGVRPFDRGNAMATMMAIRADEPQSPSAMAPDRGIPARVDRVVARALAKKPADRYPDMASFAAELRALVRPPARTLAPWIALAVVVVAGGATAWWLAGRRGGEGAAAAAGPTIEVTASRRLTMETGCEEYPRFAADGHTIIYDGLADRDYEILALDLRDGRRRRITRVPGWDYGPAVSPDGTLVAFLHEDTSGRVLRVVSAAGDGPTRDLGPIESYPAWTADGALLVGDEAGRILRRELTATGVRETVLGQLPEGGRAYHLAALAGGSIAVLWWTSAEADATALGELDATGQLRVREESLTDYEGGLAAGATGGYYFTRRGATTGNQLLYRGAAGEPVVVPGGLAPRAGVAVAADGSKLVFSTCAEKRYLARLRPGAQPAVLSRGEWQDGYPFPLPGNRMLFTSDRVGRQQAWVLDLAGGAVDPVTPADSYGASPSVDGRQVVYAAAGGRGGLAIQPLAGGVARTLTTDPSDAAPVFSRDGTQVLFERTLAGAETRVHVVAAAGGAARALVAVAGTQPAASPAGDAVAFVGPPDRAGRRTVLMTDLDGSPPRELPGLPPAAWQRPRFSADGKRLLLLRAYQEVVEVAIDGSQPPAVLWSSTTEGVHSADYAPDGDGILAALADYDGDLWLAEGRFP